MAILLKDGVKHRQWIPDREEIFEKIVKEHIKDIFGEDSEFFDIKQKIISKAGIGSIPDGYIITFAGEPRWYIVEVELSTHPLHEHIIPQISRFISGIRNPETRREIVDTLHDELRSDIIREAKFKEKISPKEIHRFLSDLVASPPTLVIIIDEKTRELEEVCNALSIETEVVGFKTFERENVGLGVHIHLYEPIFAPIVTPTEVRIEEPRPGEVLATISGKRVRITKQDVLKAAGDPRISTFKYKTTYAEIEGKRYSVKGLISIATGISTTEFITTYAEGILRKLGFSVFKVKA